MSFTCYVPVFLFLFQALKHFLKSPSTEDNMAIEMAIETVRNIDKSKKLSIQPAFQVICVSTVMMSS